MGLQIRLVDIIIIVVLILIITSGSRLINKLFIGTDNVHQLLTSSENKSMTLLNLTREEIKQYKLDTDENLKIIMDSLKVKPKNIKQIITINSTKRIDSIISHIYKIDSSNNWINNVKIDSCTSIEQYINVPLKTVTTNYKHDETIHMLIYWKRKKILGIRIGRKVYEGFAKGECSAIKAESINLIKGN